MKCEKCQDRGFIEKEYGLLMVVCDCEKGEALRAEVFGESGKAPSGEVTNDSDSGTGQPGSITGSGDTSQPKQPRQSKAKEKARAKPG